MNEKSSQKPRRKRRRYEPPVVEDVPLSPEERLLVACKASGSFNPNCGQSCENCSSAGS